MGCVKSKPVLKSKDSIRYHKKNYNVQRMANARSLQRKKINQIIEGIKSGIVVDEVHHEKALENVSVVELYDYDV